jgi:hypothetical protein
MSPKATGESNGPPALPSRMNGDKSRFHAVGLFLNFTSMPLFFHGMEATFPTLPSHRRALVRR